MDKSQSINWYNQGLFAAGLVHGLNMRPGAVSLGFLPRAATQAARPSRSRSAGGRGGSVAARGRTTSKARTRNRASSARRNRKSRAATQTPTN